MRKAGKSLSFLFLTLMVVVTVFLLSGCPGLGGGGGLTLSAANFLTSTESLVGIPERDPAYALSLFNDEKLLETINEVAENFQILPQVIIFRSNPSKSLRDSGEFLKSFKQAEEDPLEYLVDFIPLDFPSLNPDSIEDLIEWCESSETKAVIDKARRALNAIEELLKIIDRHNYCIEIKGDAKRRILEALGYPNDSRALFFDFRDAVYMGSILRTIVSIYDMKDFWVDLWNHITNNVEEDDLLKFRGLREMVEHADKQVLYFKEIYDFEVSKTKVDGYRIDGKRTLYQLFFREPPKISFVRDSGNQEFGDLSAAGIVSLKIGALSITSRTKMIDVIREIDKILPTSVLTIEQRRQVSGGVEYSKVAFDFSKIASKDPFDFKNSTFTGNPSEFSVDIENGAIKILVKYE